MRKHLLISFSILLSAIVFAQPVNDACINATVITIPSSGTFCGNYTLTGATDDGSYTTNCEVAGSQEVWFTYVTEGPNNIITVRPTGGTPASNLAVTLKPDSCNGTLISTCVSATGAATATTNWVYQTGKRVYIYVSSNTNSGGTFEICVNSYQQPAVGGKDCTTAELLCNLNAFSSPVASGSNGFQPPCFTSGPLQKPIIYKFTVGQSGLLNWRATPNCTTNATTTEFDWAVYDITAGCPGTLVKCNYNYTGGLFGISTTSPQGMQGPTSASNVGCVGGGTGTTAAEICSGSNVVAGNTYVIYIDQYTSASNCSLNFSFAGSTFTMAPAAAFTVSNATGCGSVTTSFTNNSVTATTYLWDFGDGTTSTLQNPPPKTYSTPGTYLVSLTVNSASGCIEATSRSIIVKPQPTVTVNNDTICAGSGLQATLTATPSVTGGTYSWNPGGQATQSITVAPGATTPYTVTYDLNACTATATGNVVVNSANFTVDAQKDTVICGNQSTTINAVPSSGGTYTYRWSPGGVGMNDSTLKTPTVSPAQTTRYTVVTRNSAGCSATDTVLVSVIGAGPSVKASATPVLICPGQPSTLSFILEPKFCGVNNSLLGTGSINATGDVGASNSIQSGVPTASPTVYGNFVQSTRNQYLYRASELKAALTSGGRIVAIGFNIGQFNSNATLQGFTIKMACTTDSVINQFQNNGLQTVFGPLNYVPVNAWNVHNLTNWFDWDGQSNVLVDVCWNNPTQGSANNKARVTATAYNSYVYSSGATNQCGITGGTASTQRPNTRFVKATQGYDSLVWTPNIGVNAVSNKSAVSPTANPIFTQTYTISVYNKGCAGSDNVTVQVDTSLKVNAGLDTTICTGGTAQLNATVTGNLGGVTYSWSPAGTLNSATISNPRATPAATTPYIVIATSSGCQARDTVNVIISPPTVQVTGTNVNCNGGATGTATAIPGGGVPPYFYQWSNNASTATISNLLAGTYTVTVRDNKGCTVTGSYTVTQPLILTVSQQTVRNVKCNGGNDGFVSVVVNGGTPNYNYNWLPAAANNDTIQGLTANTYALTVTDNNGCTATGSYVVAQPTALVFGTAVTKNIRCRNGTDGFITVSVSGGSPQYVYSWSHNANLNSPSATALGAGNFIVTVTDLNGCTLTQSNTLTQPANGISFNPFTVTNVTCFGGNNGTVTANPVGGLPPYKYQWSVPGNTNQITGLFAGTYRVTVSDDSLCTLTDSAIVTQPPQIIVSGTVTDVSCNGGNNGQISLSVTPLGSYNFTWTNGASGANPTTLTANTYAVTATNANGCTGTNSFVVNQPSVLSLNPPTIVDVSCFGGNDGSITANPIGGTPTYTYNWSAPFSASAQTNSGLTAANYSVTATDSKGCTVVGNYTVTQPTQLIFTQPAAIVNVLCNGASTGSISVNVSGGTSAYTYAWSNSAPSQPSSTGLAANTYQLTVTDAKGCTLADIYNITEPSAISLSTQVIRNVSCGGGNDGSASVSASGGAGNFTYLWSNGNATAIASGLNASAPYTVTVTDGNGCTATTSVSVTQPVPVTANPIVKDVSCFLYNDGSIDANPSGGTGPYTFLWSNAQTGQIAINLIANNYDCTVTDANGCSHTFSRVVSQPGLLQVTAIGLPESCVSTGDGKIIPVGLGGTTPYTFSYSIDGINFLPGASDTIRNLLPASYQVVITDGQNCTASTLVNIGSPPKDVYEAFADSTSCYGEEYKDGSIRVIGLTAVNAPHQYKIDDSDVFSQTGNFTNLSSGPHKIYALNNFGCDTTFFITVPEPLPASVDIFPDDSTIQMGQSIQLNSLLKPYPQSDITSYVWTPSTGLNCVDCANPIATPFSRSTEYFLTIYYNQGCFASTSVVVNVEGNPELFIPNVFSPNGDGVNDRFEIFGFGIGDFDLKIFNRWGEKVFESTNQFSYWDGSYKGVMQNPEVYTYLLNVTYLDSREVTKTGTVTLVR